MSDNRRNDNVEYESFDTPDIMDRIGESFASVFSRKSPNTSKEDSVLSEFSDKDDNGYELFVDEREQKKQLKKQEKIQNKQIKKDKPKKPVTPLKRKIINIVTYCAIIAVMLIVGVILSLTVLFKAQAYEVSGCTIYKEAEIIDTANIPQGSNIFLANKAAAEKRLMKNYPYIEQVEVSFSIPDTITIDIVEAVPSYIVKCSESQYLIASSKGRILKQVESIKGYDLPLFVANELTSNVVGEYVEYNDETTAQIIGEIITVFTDNGYEGITEIDATDTANVTFTYDDRIKVKLGIPEQLSYKVRTAMTIINEKLDLNGTEVTEGELDVSTCNTTKKSYFLEQSIIDSQVETTAPENDDTDDIYDDGEYSDDIEEETQAPLSPEDWYL